MPRTMIWRLLNNAPHFLCKLSYDTGKLLSISISVRLCDYDCLSVNFRAPPVIKNIARQVIDCIAASSPRSFFNCPQPNSLAEPARNVVVIVGRVP